MMRYLLSLLLLLAPVASTAGETLHVGDKAPPFSLPDLYGRAITLDYLDGNPGVLLFWSALGSGSVALLEDFNAYQERWGRENLAVIGVCADGAADGAGTLNEIRTIANRHDVVFPVLLDRSRAAAAAYGINELPTAVVIGADGNVAAIERGSVPVARQTLEEQLLAAVADAATAASPAAACSIPRARSCTRIDERDPSASNPAIMAVRLCVCHGDPEAAQLMLSAVGTDALSALDLRFALAHLLLVEGRAADARRAFEVLREQHPEAGWGEWGLGLVALAEGDPDGALAHLQAAGAGGWTIPEAETAVLKYLEGYWRANRAAPREEQFLALFAQLDSVRVCYRRLNQRG